MRMYDIILKKRQGRELSRDEINFFVQGYTKEIIPDYQVAAFLMAVYFQGLSQQETAHLTMAMVNSGDTVNLSSIPGIKVDKHSTGGVGDKTTLVLAPLVAAAGVPVAKMSGRGLGHTGGTIDKLESIPGFKVSLPPEDFIRQVKTIHVAVVAQTGELAPADKKLYALRDVTATVDSIPLIASSVMSKKIASGADAIVLDVKTGSGAFMRTVDDARSLARTMVDIGEMTGKKTAAVITNMNQPLGFAVGNVLEVTEAVNTLNGQGPADLVELCLVLGSHILVLAGKKDSLAGARQVLEELLDNGKAFSKFKEMVQAQGGDIDVLQNPSKLPRAQNIYTVKAGTTGYVTAINTEAVGRVAMMLGAGRKTKEESIDPAVGIIVRKKLGDKVQAGETIAELHVNDAGKLREAEQQLIEAYTISEHAPELNPLVLEQISS